jgi:hypothetical protein
VPGPGRSSRVSGVSETPTEKAETMTSTPNNLKDLYAATRNSAVRTDHPTLRLLTALWAGITMINFVVWAMVCTISLSWDSPWWLWTFIPGGAVLGALWWNAKREDQS